MKGAPLFSECGFLPVVEGFGFGIEPGIDFALGAEGLVDVSGFVDKVKDDFILDGFAEFVGVDVASEDFEASGFVFFEQGGACEADEGGVGHEGAHSAVEFATLGTVAFINEDEDFADAGAGLVAQIEDELLEVFDVAFAEFVDEGAEEARGGLSELFH